VSPVLHLIVCGARASAETARAVEVAHGSGFTVCVVTTPAALAFIGDTAQLARLTGRSVETRVEIDPAEARPSPDAVLVSPLTFNTLNKWALGINDNLAVGLLHDALGLGVPITAVPWLNSELASHPAARRSLDLLKGAGVAFTAGYGHSSSRRAGLDGSTAPLPYPWQDIEDHLQRMFEAVTLRG
jgi:phosphopantothenoylcysteine synthetase/decarboxylase